MNFLAEIKYKIHQYGLFQSLDRAKYWYYKQRNHSSNLAFTKDHPDIAVPPDYILYEAFGLNYRMYYEGGFETAKWISEILKKYIDSSGSKILDWGCGPARVVRHLPAFLPNSKLFGTDFNEDTIKWCSENISDIGFYVNNLTPPLDFPDSFFDAIYGISIFTHLSRANHDGWMKELYRSLRESGLLLITTQGSVHFSKLSFLEKKIFQKDEIVVREGVREGHLTYSAFQPEKAMRNLFKGYFDVLAFTPGKVESWGLGQDIWVLKKI